LKENNVEFNITNSGTQTPASGRFVFLGDIRNHDPSPFGGDDPNAIRGITKTGNGVLQLSAATTYKGATTIQDGVLLVGTNTSNTATLGDYTGSPGTLTLKGGVLGASAGTAGSNTLTLKNPLVVDSSTGTATVAQFGNNGAAVTTTMEFSSDSVSGASGSLTIANLNSTNNTAVSFRTLFSGQGFNFGLPIAIANTVNVGTGAKSSELQSGNTTGTQTFSGVISGGGSLRRLNAGGTTVLSGANTYTGGTFVDDGALTVSGSSARFGGGDVTVNGGSAVISAGVANAIADAAKLTLLGGGTGGVADIGFISLAAGINEHVASLVLGSTVQANGTYGATGSGAANINDEYFSGLGIITVAPAGLPGDFNNDGKVDAGDYATWRKNNGTSNALANDNGLGTPVGPAHYNLWRANFGNTTSGSGSSLGTAGVPEPSSLLLLIAAVSTALVTCRSRRR
jgi:autotransporter-associated beta strand protein